VPTAKVIALPRTRTGVEAAERHMRCVQRLLALAERRLLRNKREEAREWRALAELHIRLAECVRSASPSSVDVVSETVAL
jgi:hypothetical protein